MTDLPARMPLEGEILPPGITEWMAPCPTCGEAADGYESNRDLIEYREPVPLWDGGPLVAAGDLKLAPTPWRYCLFPCGHEVRGEDIRLYRAGGAP